VTLAAGPLARMRLVGVAAALLLAALAFTDSPWQKRLRLAWFDACQTLFPRPVRSLPAVVVAIDEKSLDELGQWPWPRSVTARLIDRIAAARPAAIGIDLLWADPDRYSPDAVARTLPDTEAATRERLLAMPRHDALLARAVGAAPVVVAVAGMPDPTPARVIAPPFRVAVDTPPVAPVRYAGLLTSLPEIDAAARGHGLISNELERGVVRRMPLFADVAGTLVPGLELEMIRIAAGAPAVALQRAEVGAGRRVRIGDFGFPVEADASAWVHFSGRDGRRLVSAADVMAGRAPPDALSDKLVLVGITGLGLVDYQTVPSGERMPGVEVHAQLLEMMFDDTPLVRPVWMPGAEGAWFALGALLLVWLVPAVAPRRAFGAGALVIFIGVVAAMAGFARFRVLVDFANPAFGLIALFGVLLGMALVEASRRERELALEVQRQREEAARVAGELEAARRIQTGILPRVATLASEARVEVAVTMVPAREVGGDLYDFFMIDRDRLFFLIGDVSGKGLPASIFMAVSKALAKSNALRLAAEGDELAAIGALMSATNAEVSRENGEAMFVTAFAGILDLASGRLAYCNAGHDDPWLLSGTQAPRRLSGGDGPPLCVMDDFEYAGATVQLAADELVCMVTDGVTEAQDVRQSLYGGARLAELVAREASAGASAQGLLEAVQGDVAAFVGAAEPADDLTILALRWKG
jgi:serine phosphatase RsbU (regulator of sigma subunit)/CHASE2 domain-containing sensor protein